MRFKSVSLHIHRYLKTDKQFSENLLFCLTYKGEQGGLRRVIHMVNQRLQKVFPSTSIWPGHFEKKKNFLGGRFEEQIFYYFFIFVIIENIYYLETDQNIFLLFHQRWTPFCNMVRCNMYKIFNFVHCNEQLIDKVGLRW